MANMTFIGSGSTIGMDDHLTLLAVAGEQIRKILKAKTCFGDSAIGSPDPAQKQALREHRIIYQNLGLTRKHTYKYMSSFRMMNEVIYCT